jgi:tetratricopeptide (TPR) repeat protein
MNSKVVLRNGLLILLFLQISNGMTQNDIEDKLQVICAQIVIQPENPKLLVERARLYLEAGRFDLAEKDLAGTWQLAEENYSPALIAYSELYFQQGKYAESLELVERFLDANRVNLCGFQLKAQLLEKLGRADDAIDYYKKVLIYTKDKSAEVFEPLIDLLEKQERYSEAVFYCEAALKTTGPSLELEDRMQSLQLAQAK